MALWFQLAELWLGWPVHLPWVTREAPGTLSFCWEPGARPANPHFLSPSSSSSSSDSEEAEEEGTVAVTDQQGPGGLR